MLIVDFAADDPRGVEHQPRIAEAMVATFERVDQHPRGDWIVTVLLTESAQITALHEQYFSEATDTDVMSFPSGDDQFDEGGYLGDIAISIDVAAEQAEQQGHSLTRELTYLALHGMLHLLGFRDDTPEEREEMLRVQDDLMASFERGRPDSV